MTSIWRRAQRDLAQPNDRGRLVIATESGHDIPNDQPAIVINAVRQVVSEAAPAAGSSG